MRTARRNTWEQGIRINYVAPCWIKSAIRAAKYEAWLTERGIEFGEQADCAGAMMRISCDRSVNGACDFFVFFLFSLHAHLFHAHWRDEFFPLFFFLAFFLCLFFLLLCFIFPFLTTGFLRYQRQPLGVP